MKAIYTEYLHIVGNKPGLLNLKKSFTNQILSSFSLQNLKVKQYCLKFTSSHIYTSQEFVWGLGQKDYLIICWKITFAKNYKEELMTLKKKNI